MFLGAALLFIVQPMVAKLILPQLGGSPAVWNTCLVFFQSSLLAGYVYAHGLGRIRKLRRAVTVHGLVLALPVLVLPVGLANGGNTPLLGSPVSWLLFNLLVGVAAPFVVMSTGASLLQRWFSRTDHPAANDPYFLYAASNAGSLLGLLAYPVLIEPQLTLTHQRWAWSASYVVWAVLFVACGAAAMRRPGAQSLGSASTEVTPAAPSAPERLKWVLLALAPSSLLLGVTTFLTTDLAAVPLLWVVPLSIYLITFILAFSPRASFLVAPSCWLFPCIAAVITVLWLTNTRIPLGTTFVLHLALMLLGGLACHGRLAQLRPDTSRLTEYYLLLALGGALGGTFNAIIAPMIFNTVAEYPLSIGLICILTIPPLRAAPPWATSLTRVAAAGLITAGMLRVLLSAGPGASVVHRERTFFGIHRVIATDDGWRLLMHGATIHGRQNTAANNRFFPTGYYHPSGPLADVMLLKREAGPWRDIGIVGLGSGALAAYGRNKDQRITFYELDPAVIRIATDPRLFTFTSDSKASVATVPGDARLSLAVEPEARFDVLVLDAFSSDAVPVHLLTREALALYLSKLKDGGVIALHVSNRYLDLAPVVGSTARALGLVAYKRHDPASGMTSQERAEGKSGSTAVVIARRAEDLGPIAANPMWVRIDQISAAPLWTDDYSNILSVLGTR
jgi:hypothetical protein